MDKETLFRFFSDKSSIEEQKRVLDWIEQSPANRKTFLEERKLFDAMILVADRNEIKRRSVMRIPQWVKSVTKYAAVIGVMAGVSLWYVSKQRKQLLEAFNVVSVPAGQRVNLVLPDGTKVCVNSQSELRYPSVFVGGQRQVKLTGEAFFEVEHDAKKPFVVNTYACKVEVLGTEFNVEARPERSVFSTALVKGKVKVTDNKRPESQVTLSPQQQVNHRDGRLVVSQTPEYEAFAWRNGVLAFRDASFAELIDEFEKAFGVRLVVERADITTNLYTGKIKIGDGITHALWVLQRGATFSYTWNDEKDTIYIK